jgi:hypothetical protein
MLILMLILIYTDLKLRKSVCHTCYVGPKSFTQPQRNVHILCASVKVCQSTNLKEPVCFSSTPVLQDMMDNGPCVPKQEAVFIPKDQASFPHGLLYPLRQR